MDNDKSEIPNEEHQLTSSEEPATITPGPEDYCPACLDVHPQATCPNLTRGLG